MNKPIFIYGVPGVGKTYITRQLKEELKIPLIELDSIRNTFSDSKNIIDEPFLFYGTTEAYKVFGKHTKRNIVKGLKQIRLEMQPFVIEKLDSINPPYIAECAFLDPEYVNNIGKVILIRQKNRDKHRQQFFKNREKDKNNEIAFKVARILQRFLLKESKNFNISQYSSTEINKIEKELIKTYK
jgi:2-phosphoglycerate kinase